MILGIILILTGVIGAIVVGIFGIRFMKKNQLIFKGDYVDISIEKTKKSKSEPVYETGDLPVEGGDETELLFTPQDNKVYEDSSDTELL